MNNSLIVNGVDGPGDFAGSVHQRYDSRIRGGGLSGKISRLAGALRVAPSSSSVWRRGRTGTLGRVKGSVLGLTPGSDLESSHRDE
ncbi:MAG TPA: hypothetical protein VMK12_21935 [Anaeromyxobacteraceae bacterium]|nr:hypothetical protein [Anaeromyxobacteraceae bacterium]